MGYSRDRGGVEVKGLLGETRAMFRRMGGS